VEVQCAACGETFDVPETLSESRIVCPTCGQATDLPPRESTEQEAPGRECESAPPSQEVASSAADILEESREADSVTFDRGPSLSSDGDAGYVAPSSGHETYALQAPVADREEESPVAVPPRPVEEAVEKWGRTLDIGSAAVAVAAALVLLGCFRALWRSLGAVEPAGPTGIARTLVLWLRSVPRALLMQPPADTPGLSVAGQVLVCALLAVLTVRVLLRMQLADLCSAPAAAGARHCAVGILYHLVPAGALLALLALGAACLAGGGPSRRYLVGWVMACFVLVSAGWFAGMRILGHFARGGLTPRMWNNGACGIGATLLILFDGLPGVPLSALEQTSLLVGVNSLLAFALTARVFEGGGERWLRGLGFFAGCAIIWVIAAVVLVTT